MSALEEVFRISRAQTLIALCGTVPGYWFTVALIDVVGRFAVQLLGFFMMTVFMLGLAVPYHHWTTPGNHIGFVVMYAFTFFFANFGPAQQHDLYRARRDLPGAAAVDVPRHLRRRGEGRRHHRGVRVPVRGAEPGQEQGGPRVPRGHRRPQLALRARRGQHARLPTDVPRAGVRGEVARGDVRRGRRRRGGGRRRPCGAAVRDPDGVV
uniref:Major facilitator superfamily (MFS) profile domain-containing protein n=1 Tax=Setaria viridis TaxID=4556 RepID=A0A4U6U089_SETVI|nr:hypothetical protein SEVIR_6G010350v2 [Setaria viridis]